MKKNLEQILNEGFFKTEKNTFGGEDLKIVNDAIHYMKYIEAYSFAIKYNKYAQEFNEGKIPFFDPKNDNYMQLRKEFLNKISKKPQNEAFIPKPKDDDNLKKSFFQKDEALKFIKLLNSAVIKYQDLYQKMFQLLGKYPQLQKIYGPYANNNQIYANMFDCPTWEERKSLGKFSSDEQILQNLLKFKENLKKVLETTQSGEEAFNYSEIVTKLLKDPKIREKYNAELLNKIVKNLQLESINESNEFDQELDLDTEKEKIIEILKSLLISYSDSEERMQKLADPNNAEKIRSYIFSKIRNTTKQDTNTSKQDIINKLSHISSQIQSAPKSFKSKQEIISSINSVLDVLKNELEPDNNSQEPTREKISQFASNIRGK